MCPRVCFHISKNLSVDITKPTASMWNVYGSWYSLGLFASKILEFFFSPRNYSHFLCKNIQQFGVFFHVIKGSRGIHLFIILLFKSTGRMMWILKNVYVQTHTHLPTFTDSPQSYLLVNFFYRCCCHWLYVKLTVHFKFGHLSDPLDISVPCKNSVIFLFVNSTTKVYISE